MAMSTHELERMWINLDARDGFAMPEHPAGNVSAELAQLRFENPLSSITSHYTYISGQPHCCC